MVKKNKNIETKSSVPDYLTTVEDPQKRDDCHRLVKIMEKITGKPAKMWGASMVGFGTYYYKYKSGHEGDCFLVGFSPRKSNLSIYIMAGFDRYPELMKDLGKYKIGKSCLLVKKLDDIDGSVLINLIRHSVDGMKKTYKVT